MPSKPKVKRVLLLCDFFSYFGGTEYYNAALAAGLKRMGVEVKIYIGERPRHRYWEKHFDQLGIAYERPDKFHIDKHNKDIEAVFIDSVVDEIRDWKPDIIHTHPFKKMAITWLKNPHSDKTIPIVATEWTMPGEASAHWFDDETSDYVNSVGAFIATCDTLKRAIKSHHGYRGKVATIPHLVEPPKHQIALKDAKKASINSVGYVGRLSAEKGVDLLLQSWQPIQEQFPDASLHIYGHGPDEASLVALRDTLGLSDSVYFAGTFKPYTGINDVASRHQIFVQPSLFESIPTSIIELMLRGKTIVASDVGGVAEVVNETTGILVPPANIPALSAAIRQALENPQVTYQLGKNARITMSEQYDLEKNLLAIYNLYHSLL